MSQRRPAPDTTTVTAHRSLTAYAMTHFDNPGKPRDEQHNIAPVPVGGASGQGGRRREDRASLLRGL